MKFDPGTNHSRPIPQMQDIVLPIEDASELDLAWKTKIKTIFDRLLLMIKDAVGPGVCEELPSIPTLEQFTSAVGGQ